jgi:hypothetical protein
MDRIGRPESLTMAFAVTFVRPFGATMRVHQLPKLSRYAATGSGGSKIRSSRPTRSETRVKWTLRLKMIGVGCGHS